MSLVPSWYESYRDTFGIFPRATERERLLAALTIAGDCWLWPDGEPMFVMAAGRPRPLHRVAYAMLCGPLAPAARVTTTCGNPRCCAPGHMTVSRQTSKHDHPGSAEAARV